MKYEHGVSLFELIVVVAIVALATAIGAPGFGNSMKNARVASAAAEAHVSFSLARNTAIARNRNVVACNSKNPTAASPSCAGGTQWESGWLVFVDENQNNAFDDGTDELIEQHAKLAGKVYARYTRNSVVRFQPNGMATGTNGGLRICDDRAKAGLTKELRPYMRQVVVNNVGRVESKAFDGTTSC